MKRFALVLTTAVACAPPSARRETPVEHPTVTPAGTEAPANPSNPAAPAGTVAEPPGREPLSEGVPNGDDLVRGRATVRVDAPVDKVREVVQKYGDYAEFMPFYKSSHVVDEDDARTKVYMQVAALNGLVKMGAQLSLPNQPQKAGGWDVYESRFEQGNVQDFKAIWRLKPIDDGHTFLSLEVFLLPKLPLPTSTLNKENIKGALNGAKAMRDRIEGRAPTEPQ